MGKRFGIIRSRQVCIFTHNFYWISIVNAENVSLDSSDDVDTMMELRIDDDDTLSLFFLKDATLPIYDLI